MFSPPPQQEGRSFRPGVKGGTGPVLRTSRGVPGGSNLNQHVRPRRPCERSKQARMPVSTAILKTVKSLPKRTGRVEGAVRRACGGRCIGIPQPDRARETLRHDLVRRAGSAFRDWAGEATHHPREVIGQALARRLKDKSEAVYARGDLFQKRAR